MEIIIFKILLYFVSILAIAYFSATETALTSLTTVNLANLKQKNAKLSRYFELWEKKPSEILIIVLIGANTALIGNGVLITSLAIDIAKIYATLKDIIFLLIPILTGITTLIVGQILPKIISRYATEKIAILVIRILIFFNILFSPLARVILKISENIISFLGGYKVRETPFLKPEELKILLRSDETIPIPDPARKIMENLIDFANTKIYDVMVPRSHIQAVDIDQSIDDIINQVIDKGYSRIPIYKENLDNILGIIYSKDLALAWRGGSLFVINDLIRPAYFVPGSAKINQVLREFKMGHQHMAIVVDEYGSTIGIATIEDLVEEIVGDIWDEYDIKEKTIIPSPDGSWLIRSTESLEVVNEELKLSLPSEDFNTIGGWVLDLFGRIPKIGESIYWDNLKIEIDDADKKKINRIKIRKIR